MKKSIITALVLGLLAGGMLAVPAEGAKKKKKKPKPVTVAMFIRDEAVDDCDAASYNLKWVDGPDEESCNVVTTGAGNEVIMQAGDPLGITSVWTAVPGAGAEFQLNTAEDIVANFTMASYAPEGVVAVGAGQMEVNVTLTGTTGGEAVTIASGSGSYTAVPGTATYPVEFTMEADPELNKKKFESLELTSWVGGVGALSGWFELEDPASYFTMSILTKGGKLPKGATPPPAAAD